MDKWEARYSLMLDEALTLIGAIEEHFGGDLKNVPAGLFEVIDHLYVVASAHCDCDEGLGGEPEAEVIPKAFADAFGLTGEVSAGVVARELGVGRATVNRWLTDGALPAIGRTAAGHYRVDMKVVTTLRGLRQRGIHLDTHTVKASCISLQ